MSSTELLILSVALGADLFSVSVPIGMFGVRLKMLLHAAAVFAIFHIVMILTGYFAGHWLGEVVEHVGTYHIDYPAALVQNWACLIGAVILIALGLHMVRENIKGSFTAQATASLQGLSLCALAFSVSVDALVAGFSMGMMDVDLVKLSLILGGVIFSIAILGLSLGRYIGRYFGAHAGIAGALVLIGLGIHIVWTTGF